MSDNTKQILQSVIVTPNSVVVVVNGNQHQMEKTHHNYSKVIDALNEDNIEVLEDLFDTRKAVAYYSDGNVTVQDGQVFYRGEQLHNSNVNRLLTFMREKLPYKPFVKFLDRLMENPSRRSVEELYSFMEHRGISISMDGHLLAYKAVNSEFRDYYSGKFDNSVGNVVEIQRNEVCDDANFGCSEGLHAGSYDYAKDYGRDGGHLLRIKIDPKDVVSVPHCSQCQKLRCSKYEVLEVVETMVDKTLDDKYDHASGLLDSDASISTEEMSLAQ